MPVSQLSDGIKSILAMVADIAHRCVRLNPQFGAEAARQTPGIVLIDEVELHLHPGWQQTIIASLQAAFPHIQFIVTTHSPQVLTTVPAECIRILSVTPDGMGHIHTPDRQTQGTGSASVLAQLQGVNSVPPLSIVRDLSTYTALIQQGQGESDEAKRLRTLLDAHFGADHPLIVECDRLLRYQAFKVRLPSRGSS
jgi:predicted ATP-binding protein involved in virulence